MSKPVPELIAVPQAHCPTPPADFVPLNRVTYRGTTPVLDELALVQASVAEIQRFEDYDDVLGRTAPSAPVVAQACDAAAQWSSERRIAEAWLRYVTTQEVIAWKGTRTLLDDLKAAFKLAASRDATLESNYPHLTRLFAVRDEMAQRAAATRARKKKATEASGEVSSSESDDTESNEGEPG
jgi:hypothetical protein